jgi:hypothetical protein
MNTEAMQAGKAAAAAKREAAEQAETERCAALHTQAYIDLLRVRAENEARGKTVATDWLDIGD